VVELALDGGQVVEDVGVVELEVVEDGGARAVVHKLAALVEESGVVLVGFDHEIPAAPQPRRNTEVQRHAADQKARLQTGLLQHPGEHGGGGGLAVGACHCQHMLALQHMLGQPLRAAGVGRAGFQDGFHQGKLGRAVALAGAADHVADDIHVGLECHLVGAKAFDQVNPQCPQLVAHRGVHAGIAAGDFVAGFAGQGRDTAHEGAADAKDVNVHGHGL